MSCAQQDFPGAKTLTIAEPNIYNVAGNALAAVSFSPVDAMSGYKRSVINMQIPAYWELEHIYIDYILGFDEGGPAGYYPFDTDIAGYANSPTAPIIAGGGAAALTMLAANYSGNYILIGRGRAR